MKGYVGDLEKATGENENFRKVLYTAKHSQLVVMSLSAGEDIGEEVHQLDQFLRIESGTGKAILDGMPQDISDGFAIIVPSGARHNIINTGQTKMKLYSVYSPPNHKNATTHKAKSDAEADEGEHFDGKTSE